MLFAFPLIASLVPQLHRLPGSCRRGRRRWPALHRPGQLAPPVQRSGGLRQWRAGSRRPVVFVPRYARRATGVAYLLTAKHPLWFSVFRTLFYLPTMVPFIASVLVGASSSTASPAGSPSCSPNVGITTPTSSTTRSGSPRRWMISLWGINNAMILNIAALDSVPKDLYEAARSKGPAAGGCSATSRSR